MSGEVRLRPGSKILEMPNISHVQRSCAMPEEKMHKNLTKSIPNFMNKTIESVFDMSRSGNIDEYSNMIGNVSNRKQTMEHVVICSAKCRKMKKKCLTTQTEKNRVIERG